HRFREAEEGGGPGIAALRLEPPEGAVALRDDEQPAARLTQTRTGGLEEAVALGGTIEEDEGPRRARGERVRGRATGVETPRLRGLHHGGAEIPAAHPERLHDPCAPDLRAGRDDDVEGPIRPCARFATYVGVGRVFRSSLLSLGGRPGRALAGR